MSELTDLEIAKKIAEIEGFKFGTVHGTPVIVSDSEDCTSFDPLTDDALCFKLMVKYRVSLSGYNQPDGVISAYDVDKNGYINKECSHTSPNRAICLCIIEAHKGK